MNRSELGQSLNLKIELIPEGKPNRSGRKISPDFITIHNTSNANPGADANAHSRFVRNKGHYILASGKRNDVSWHYTVDDKCVIKHLPVTERAIHAGAGNGRSIAIEICMHQEIDQNAANERASRLVAALMHDLGIPKTNVVPHKHWTGKNCPTLLLSDGFEAFAAACNAICNSIEEDVSASALVNEDERQILRDINDGIIVDALANEPPEDDIDEEHDLIAAEVASFVGK